MTDEHGDDEKLLTVPAGDPRWDHVQDVDDLPAEWKGRVEHFFAHLRTWNRASTAMALIALGYADHP